MSSRQCWRSTTTLRRFAIATGSFASVLCAISCADSKPAKSADEGSQMAALSSVERYFPLRDNTVYSYSTVDENTGEKGLLIMQISRPRPDFAKLKTGNKTHHLNITEAGVEVVTGGFLLRSPLQMNATWRGPSGKIWVSAVDKSVQVEAGSFSGCVETVEEAQSASMVRSVTTVYCPDVGIVTLTVEANSAGEFAAERAELRSYGPRVDINDLDETQPPP